MAILEVRNLSFTYPDAEKAALNGITLTLEEGDFVLLCGPTGSGKTTLLHHLKKTIQPVGQREGEICYRGVSFNRLSAEKSTSEIGIVFQDPEQQIVMDTVSQELAFALENLGCSPLDMNKRIGELAHFFNLEALFHTPVHHLSGGQKQLLNLASVLLLQPKVLLLDEPTAQLDPLAAKEFLQLIKQINEEFATTIIISEHRLAEIYPLVNRIMVLDDGDLIKDENPRNLIAQLHAEGHAPWTYFVPKLSQYCLSLAPQSSHSKRSIPLTVKEGKRWLNRETSWQSSQVSSASDQPKMDDHAVQPNDGQALFTCCEVTFQYTRSGRRLLNGLDVKFPAGEIVAVLGGNGAGKSTLLKVLLGLLKPQKGKVYYRDTSIQSIAEPRRFQTVAYLDQNPKLYFAFDTVEEVLRQRCSQLHLSLTDEHVQAVLDHVQLSIDEWSRHPYDLSGGEQQKLALALLLLADPDVLLLDEPTKGLDPQAKAGLGSRLLEWRQTGRSIILVSHDLEFVEDYATRCGLLFDGRMTDFVTPQHFFSGNYFYTTPVYRLLNGLKGRREDRKV
jgi:energy-coupling factor transporter ATP-binding protein EcfA2